MGNRIFRYAVAALVLAGGLAMLGLMYQTLGALREQNQVLARKLEDLRRLEANNLRLNRMLSELRREQSGRLTDELARLRREFDRLQAQREEWERLCAQSRALRAELGNAVRPVINRDSWTYVGYVDPEAALQSTLWAWASGDPALVIASMPPAARAVWGNLSDEEVAARLARTWRLSSGFQVLGQKKLSDDEVAVIVNMYPDRPEIENAVLHFRRIGTEWRQDLDLYPLASERGETGGRN
jgi:hypothetical protein